MYVMQISTHSPESCPDFNPETRKPAEIILQQLDSLLAKHGVKVVGSWTDHATHTIYNVYETPSFDAYWACWAEPELYAWLSFNSVTSAVVNTREEIQAMLARR